MEKIATTRIRTPVVDLQGGCSTTELWRLVISTDVAGLLMRMCVLCHRECLCSYITPVASCGAGREWALSPSSLLLLRRDSNGCRRHLVWTIAFVMGSE